MNAHLMVIAALVAGGAPANGGPRLDPERRATFTFRSPDAERVVLRLDGQPLSAMVRDGSGTWSVTTPSLEPGVYTYAFYVGNQRFHDPTNPLRKPVHGGGFESVLRVRGQDRPIWDKPARMGRVREITVRSSIFGEPRRFLVYVPAGVRRERLPVLFLLHGATEEPHAWLAAGHADAVLENLIAGRRAVKMLLVMTLGYGFAQSERNVMRVFSAGAADQRAMADRVARHLLEEVEPEVGRRFAVLPGRQSRAVAGLSMGGAQACYLGLRYPDRFAAVGSFGGAMMIFGSVYDTWFPNPPKPEAAPSFTIRCGKSDFTLPSNAAFRRWLDAKGVRHTSQDGEGGHIWDLWIRDLSAFLPTLFRQNTRTR